MTNQEMLVKEIEKAMKKLSGMDPATPEYSTVRSNYERLLEAFHKDLAACDEELDKRAKRDLERRKQDLAEKEANMRMELEKAKLKIAEKEAEEKAAVERARKELAEKEARARWRQTKIEAGVRIGCTVLAVVGSGACILLTASCEETSILSNKCLAWVGKLAVKPVI